jgi:hypothetical protein
VAGWRTIRPIESRRSAFSLNPTSTSNSHSDRGLVGPHPGTTFGWGILHPELKDHISMLRYREHDRGMQHSDAITHCTNNHSRGMAWRSCPFHCSRHSLITIAIKGTNTSFRKLLALREKAQPINRDDNYPCGRHSKYCH